MCSETGSVYIEINGITFKTLVDTGAQVSCIAHSVFKQLKLTTDTDRPKQTLTHAGGGPLHTHGTSTVTLTVETIPFTHSFHIIETPSHKIILGIDFLKSTEANILLPKRQLQFHTTNHIHTHQYNTFTAKTKSAITLPPKSLTLISVTCNTEQDVNTCIAEPVTSLALKHNIAGARCIVQTNNSTTCYQVFNPSDTTVTLQQGTVVATLTHIPDDDIFTQEANTSFSNTVTNINKCTLDNSSYLARAEELNINLQDSALTQEQKQNLMVLLGQYRHVFAKDASELTGTTKCYHTIHTGTSAPVRSFPYKQSPQTARETEKLVKCMLDTNLIQPSTSPWSSPVVLVKKKTGDYRFAVDYRKLNAVTEDLFFSIPTFSEVVDTVAEAKPK